MKMNLQADVKHLGQRVEALEAIVSQLQETIKTLLETGFGSSSKKWWESGTMHSITAEQWVAAGMGPSSYLNKCGTISDYLYMLKLDHSEISNMEWNNDPNILLVAYVNPILIMVEEQCKEPLLSLNTMDWVIITCAYNAGFIKSNPLNDVIDQQKNAQVKQALLDSPNISQHDKDILTGDSPVDRGIRKAKKKVKDTQEQEAPSND